MTSVREAIKKPSSNMDIAKQIIEDLPEEQKTEWKLLISSIANSHKSKTIWFGSGLILFGFLQFSLPYIQTIISPEYYGVITSSTGVVVMILRYLTTKSLEEK
jgi:uncharacterized membrane protein HdeD (DUF308 family)